MECREILEEVLPIVDQSNHELAEKIREVLYYDTGDAWEAFDAWLDSTED
jgi:hypothetical protein